MFAARLRALPSWRRLSRRCVCDCNLFDGNDDDAALLPSLVGAENDEARDENNS
jgi:hypothetical protein